ncbi:threonine/homoserine/homoserine lactone efflux protein [Sphingomonas sp. SORGH_AS870]|uniref:LysE family translocator n=1 Tax=Sphingomonas sp. SORGH_AS_0870 TaxID=3041801 RepID=UPI0028664195|nr:LysE family transporter [Sphingomonas sp. SORGH_AS_0870]MDR6147638.1 threonine/homoserine/homoserine lactone efflux protein [Sphingomonas sp. SORGH_AS_0870]
MSNLLLILPVIWLAVISPGADFAMISRVSAIDGRRAGLMAALGIALGCWLHIAYAAFGLGLVAHLFPQFLSVLKLTGALYLVWLGWTMATAQAVTAPAEGVSPRNRRRPLVTGLLTNALNPKTSIFVVSLYAQAIEPGTQLAVKLSYGAIISLSHLAWFAAVALFLSHPAIRAWVLARQHVVNRIIGTVLILLGVALGLADLGGRA